METGTGKMRLVERLPELGGKLLKHYVRYIDLLMFEYMIFEINFFLATKLK